MKFKIFTLISFSFLLAHLANAQQNVSFWLKSGKEVFHKDSADFIRIISMPDSGTKFYNIKEFYKDGKPKLVGKTSRPEMPMLEQQCITFYPSGKRKLIQSHQQGHEVGIAYSFYPNGKIYITRKYDSVYTARTVAFGNNYKIVACYDSTG